MDGNTPISTNGVDPRSTALKLDEELCFDDGTINLVARMELRVYRWLTSSL